jgi:hypothetical protein
VIALLTDEPPLSPGGDPLKCPAWLTTTLPALTAEHARFIGVLGSAFAAGTDTDLKTMATATGAVDATNSNAPIVVDGANSASATALETAVRTLVTKLPLGLTMTWIDDSTDAVDAIAAFVGHAETSQLGTAACTGSLAEHDSNGDGFADAFDAVRTGTPVCWKLVPTQNATVPPTAVHQVFKTSIEVTADGTFALDAHDVYFIVPAAFQDP